MPTLRKIQLCGVFLLGGFAVASAIVRMVICIKQNTPSAALDQQYIMGMPTYDITGITSHGLFWTVVETNVALIACCLPRIRPMFSISGVGSLMVSMGSFLQKVGSSMGTHNSKSTNSGSGQFSKIPVATIGSTPHSRANYYRSAEKNPTGSDISLIEMGNKVETATVELPLPSSVAIWSLNAKKYPPVVLPRS